MIKNLGGGGGGWRSAPLATFKLDVCSTVHYTVILYKSYQDDEDDYCSVPKCPLTLYLYIM